MLAPVFINSRRAHRNALAVGAQRSQCSRDLSPRLIARSQASDYRLERLTGAIRRERLQLIAEARFESLRRKREPFRDRRMRASQRSERRGFAAKPAPIGTICRDHISHLPLLHSVLKNNGEAPRLRYTSRVQAPDISSKRRARTVVG